MDRLAELTHVKHVKKKWIKKGLNFFIWKVPCCWKWKGRLRISLKFHKLLHIVHVYMRIWQRDRENYSHMTDIHEYLKWCLIEAPKITWFSSPLRMWTVIIKEFLNVFQLMDTKEWEKTLQLRIMTFTIISSLLFITGYNKI